MKGRCEHFTNSWCIAVTVVTNTPFEMYGTSKMIQNADITIDPGIKCDVINYALRCI